MKITRTSMLTGDQNSRELSVTQSDLDRYYGGLLLQDAFPYLSADDREFIKTGITTAEWDLFALEQEQDQRNIDEGYDDVELIEIQRAVAMSAPYGQQNKGYTS
jgi:hypothetical protein